MTSTHVKTLIIGAGAAGLMCAAHAGPDTLVIDHAKKPGEKIRISGGGRCNFTNLDIHAGAYLSNNPHFVKSSLKRYTQWDFTNLIERYNISYHEKTLGQLFCDGRATQIIEMLLSEIEAAKAQIRLNTKVERVKQNGRQFEVTVSTSGATKTLITDHLVIATGGKSIPKMGATGFAYQIAQQFGLKVTPTRAGLVPFTFSNHPYKDLSGTALPVKITAGTQSFEEALLFTHRGLSGPAALQASSYWQEGAPITLNLTPRVDLLADLKKKRTQLGKKSIATALSTYLPNRLLTELKGDLHLDRRLADQSNQELESLTHKLNNWSLKPTGTEGYRTAEVTLGGIDTDELSSKTFESKNVPNLYFIGESIDVTGWLGGYNFQWAWSSGYCAGQAIAQA